MSRCNKRRLQSARGTEISLRRLTREYRLAPGNVRKALVATVTARALYASELWWGGETASKASVRGTLGRRTEIQLMINRLARATTGTLRTTPLGPLIKEAGMRSAESMLNNRCRRYALRLLGLPRGNLAGQVVADPPWPAPPTPHPVPTPARWNPPPPPPASRSKSWVVSERTLDNHKAAVETYAARHSTRYETRMAKHTEKESKRQMRFAKMVKKNRRTYVKTLGGRLATMLEAAAPRIDSDLRWETGDGTSHTTIETTEILAVETVAVMIDIQP